FISSRRRHTRSKRDWSSDVCSSDLEGRVSFWVKGFDSSTGGVARFIDIDNEHCRALRVRHDCVLAPGERWAADGVEAWSAFPGGGIFAPGFGKVPVHAGVKRFTTKVI